MSRIGFNAIVILRATAFLAGFLLVLVFVITDTFVIRGLWMPLSVVIGHWLILRKLLGDQLNPSLRLLFASYCLAFLSLWALGIRSAPVMGIRGYSTVVSLLLPAAAMVLAIGAVVVSGPLLVEAKRSLRWLSLALVVGLCIAYFSSTTGRPGPMINWFEVIGLTEQQAELATLILRKVVHFVTYFTLAGAVFTAACRLDRPRSLALKSAFGFALLLSLFDELRQAGSFGRTGSTWDVLLDASGMLVALALLSRFIRNSSYNAGQ